ncbi:GtrA family protein [Clostridium saccharoperbutylacetonicum]|jgi:putative flippase GtrA|uniref:GtrA family protein n=1 Tax=Clostridium saccharoperbutylacetonicum TaxID=36745 RepID=UPI000983AD08|nr:GtrA family protein [Clostridium saccharoperbutylacetonicum]AQR92825.1 GtrA-like protein [Clostridium saccharoperbutylacetonicum]NSB34236.1 putative flippase GtrA [Clostridium saccharoperbutylacetonicum]
MDNFIEKFRNTFFTKQFIIFVLIGIVNTFNGTVFSYIFSSFLSANIAFIPGYISGLLISYILNSFITFKEKLSLEKLTKFTISSMPNFFIQYIVVIICTTIGLHKLFAYMLAAIIGVPVTFILMKFFTFRNRSNK